MEDDIDCSQDDLQFVDDDGSKGNGQSKIIINYNINSNNESNYNLETFDYDMMFMEVSSHRKKIAPGKYNDTVFGNSTSIQTKKTKQYESYSYGDYDEEESKSSMMKRVLPKSILKE